MPEPLLDGAGVVPVVGELKGSFAWRFNRRFQLTSLIPRLVHSAVRTAPLPYHQLVAG